MAAFLDGEEKAALETIEKAIEKAVVEEETEFECEDQVFEDYESLHLRLNRTLYYDRRSTSSSTDRLSFGVTELSVDAFNHLGLGGSLQEKIEKLDRLDVCRAAQVTRGTSANPTSLVLALMYLERLRSSNPSYLTSISSTDLFLVSLMVASKYLHDDGEEDEVFNEEWAKSGGLERKELNRLEMEFLTSIDWRLHHTPGEFEEMVKRLETAVVKRQLSNRNWKNATYCDMLVLSRDIGAQNLWDTLVALTLKVMAVSVAAYAASLVTMMGTCHMLNQVKLGPSAVSESVNTIYNSLEVPVSHNKAPENSTNVPDAAFYHDAAAYDIRDSESQPDRRVTNRTLILRPSTCSGGGRRTMSGLLYFNFRPPGRTGKHRVRQMKFDGHGWFTAPLAGKV